jgi:hypothetical protein
VQVTVFGDMEESGVAIEHLNWTPQNNISKKKRTDKCFRADGDHFEGDKL